MLSERLTKTTQQVQHAIEDKTILVGDTFTFTGRIKQYGPSALQLRTSNTLSTDSKLVIVNQLEIKT